MLGVVAIPERAFAKEPANDSPNPPAQYTPETPLAAKLKSTIIPSIDFENVPLDEAIAVLKQKSIELAPKTEAPRWKGINFVIRAPREKAGANAEPPASIAVMHLKNLPLGDVLRYVCESTRMSFTTEKHAVILTPLSMGNSAPAALSTDGSAPANTALAKLKALRLPVVMFDDITLEEAVDFVRLRLKELDTKEPDPEKRGMNFVIRSPRAGQGAATDNPLHRTIQQLDLKSVPASDVLRYIGDATDMTVTVDQYAVVLTPKTKK